MGQRPYPPWPRTYSDDCTGTNDCLLPLDIALSNVQINHFDFVVETEMAMVDIGYVLQWKDSRLFGSMINTPGDVWQPQLVIDMKYIDQDGTVRELQLISRTSKAQDNTIHVSPAQCTEKELELISQGQDVGCCKDEGACLGSSAFQSFVNCPSFDDCTVQVSRVMKVVAKIPKVDYSDFPFDQHNLQVHVYVANPYKSAEDEWWSKNNPKAPAISLADYGFNIAKQATDNTYTVCNGSIARSMQNLRVGGFDVDHVCSEMTDTPLVVALNKAEADGTYASIPTYALTDGMGGVVMDVTFSRQSTYVIRYFVFPMLLIGLITCTQPMLNDNLVEQVGVRVGMAGVAILTALSCSYDVTPLSASAEQLTTVDRLSIITMAFGALVAIQSLLAYALWRNDDCNRMEPWTCWRVLCFDYFSLVLFVGGYIYFVLLFTFMATSGTLALVFGIVAGLMLLGALGGMAWGLKKWSDEMKIPPSLANYKGTAGAGGGADGKKGEGMLRPLDTANSQNGLVKSSLQSSMRPSYHDVDSVHTTGAMQEGSQDYYGSQADIPQYEQEQYDDGEYSYGDGREPTDASDIDFYSNESDHRMGYGADGSYAHNAAYA
ncbi:hypothetical protein SARC_06587 [Sphaeroforma arctica JP610]|uniref:Neurotransmitter-gated ion-channel ligand-binding domain-containing protein n=1 Tax=Sphaeroforma arctica JP610 TaxID=667725 RepID=A0A0L0FWT9_9EUKA|nr:hypothetical protein SARC_06587 [Sphaeroforma arctica JP610]KNC81084.1 hypothetical protein SARC_06587 [Sphaeroforma arctica JP610]|eukprot:XP_014154986.1 hypothetical protein SARC_06587 [Sphaeroforma arctica JP610]